MTAIELLRRVKPSAWLAGAMLVLALAAPARAQIAVIVNGTPVTQLDIEQRIKLMQLISQKHLTRKESMDELINDQVKLSVAKRYGFEIPANEVDEAYSNMARNGRMTPDQLTQQLASKGVQASAMKARIKAEMTWSQIVRGKFSSTLNVADSEVALILRNQNVKDQDEIGYTYTLYPITYIVSRNSPNAVLEGKKREADALRERFQNCGEGLRLARALRDVAVREPIQRSSADLNQQLRDLLAGMEVGRLTAPELSGQGFQMFALCDKKQTTQDSPAKRKVRDEVFNKRFEAEGKKYLEAERKQSMIEYR